MSSERCAWASDVLLAEYHDTEWGVPNHDDALHFELLTLEGAQSGLSWRVVLQKRDGYRRCFADFDAARVARFGPHDVDRIVADPSIVRHRQKIESTITNAARLLEIAAVFGSFDEYLWQFTDHQVVQNAWTSSDQIPAESEVSKRLSTDLRSRGLRFCGPVVCHSFLQAVGVVNDHITSCPRWRDLC